MEKKNCTNCDTAVDIEEMHPESLPVPTNGYYVQHYGCAYPEEGADDSRAWVTEVIALGLLAECSECGADCDGTYRAALCDSGIATADLPAVCQACYEAVEWHAAGCDCAS